MYKLAISPILALAVGGLGLSHAWALGPDTSDNHPVGAAQGYFDDMAAQSSDTTASAPFVGETFGGAPFIGGTEGKIPPGALSSSALASVAVCDVSTRTSFRQPLASASETVALRLTSAAAASSYVEGHGLTAASPFQHVGDYWQGRALDHGNKAWVYVFENGSLWIRTEPQVQTVAVEGPAGILRTLHSRHS